MRHPRSDRYSHTNMFMIIVAEGWFCIGKHFWALTSDHMCEPLTPCKHLFLLICFHHFVEPSYLVFQLMKFIFTQFIRTISCILIKIIVTLNFFDLKTIAIS